jgi:RNA polymerase sigma-70 factor (ECF subfamily)
MLEDRLLVRKCRRGSSDAMARIYNKYKNYLLTLARALLHDRSTAEDIVHDVFVTFAQSAGSFQLTGSLRGYLATCVANRARDRLRTTKRHPENLDSTGHISSNTTDPQQNLIEAEQLTRLRNALSQLPYEQRETLILRTKGQMKFREIARHRGVSISTIHGRYRYGLDKLRSLLNSEVQ